MSDLLELPLVPSTDARVSRLGKETVFLNLTTGTYFGTDETGSRIWDELSRGSSFKTICECIAADYGITVDQVLADCRQFVADLVEHGLLVEAK